MLLKQLLQQIITVERHLPLPKGTTHVVIANDITTSGLGAIYKAEEAVLTIKQWIYPFPSPMDVLYYQLDHKDIIYLERKLRDLTKNDIISLGLEVEEPDLIHKKTKYYFGKLKWGRCGTASRQGIHVFVEHDSLDDTLESLAQSYSKYYGEPYEVKSFDILEVHWRTKD